MDSHLLWVHLFGFKLFYVRQEDSCSSRINIRTYGLELWGTTKLINSCKIQSLHSIILRRNTSSFCYVSNSTFNRDLDVPFDRDSIRTFLFKKHAVISPLTSLVTVTVRSDETCRWFVPRWTASLDRSGIQQFSQRTVQLLLTALYVEHHLQIEIQIWHVHNHHK